MLGTVMHQALTESRAFCLTYSICVKETFQTLISMLSLTCSLPST